MATDESEMIRCGNPACKCSIAPSESACSDYCSAVLAWHADEVQNDVCGCGHPHCASPGAVSAR